MKYTKQIILSVFGALLLSCCSQQQARKPISQSSGAFLNESVDRNKKLISGEEAKIDSIIKSNPSKKYIASTKGYWYCYDTPKSSDVLTPKKGDVAYFNYEIKDLNGNVIYSELELRPQVYHVDKEQKIIIGLRDGIKLMHKNETITFLFPSHMAYGYHGDERRIDHNKPIMCTVTLNNFEPEAVPAGKVNTQIKTKTE